MIASDTLFDSRGCVFGVMLSDEDIAEIECLWVVAIATNFAKKLTLFERQRLWQLVIEGV